MVVFLTKEQTLLLEELVILLLFLLLKDNLAEMELIFLLLAVVAEAVQVVLALVQQLQVMDQVHQTKVVMVVLV